MKLISRISQSLLAVPVFVKVIGIALGAIVLLSGGMLWQIHQTWHAMALRDLERRGYVIANDIAVHTAPLVRTGNTTELQRVLEQVRDGVTEIQHIVVRDGVGHVLARADAGTADATVREIAVPIAGGNAGEVRVTMAENHVAYEVGWLARHLARTTAVIAALGMAAAWWLTRVLTYPIRELVDVTHAVQHGDFQARAPVRANDEIGDLAAAFNDMTAELQRKETVRRKLLRRVIEAGEHERKRLARELHDQTGQSLTSLIAGLGALEPCAPDAACATKLRELRNLASQTLSEVHAVSVELRPSVLDDVGLAPALEKHCQTFSQRLGVRTESQTVGLDDGARLPVEIETTLYRMVQEALTNATRHGRARNVHVLVQRKHASVLAVVEDDGDGFDATDWRAQCLRGDHLGLLGIEERAALLGGTLRIESHPGKGTSLFVEIPCPPSVS